MCCTSRPALTASIRLASSSDARELFTRRDIGQGVSVRECRQNGKQCTDRKEHDARHDGHVISGHVLSLLLPASKKALTGICSAAASQQRGHCRIDRLAVFMPPGSAADLGPLEAGTHPGHFLIFC
jgi:hypothetical protein